MNIREADLPGIGKKFQVETRAGDKLVMIIHDDNRQEIYSFAKDDPDETICTMTLEDAEARQIAGIIGGMAYQPKALKTVETSLEDLVIEWYKLEPYANCIDKTIGEMNFRQNTGVNVIAVIEKDHKSKINPGPDYRLTVGSTLVVAGERQHIKQLKEIVENPECTFPAQ